MSARFEYVRVRTIDGMTFSHSDVWNVHVDEEGVHVMMMDKTKIDYPIRSVIRCESKEAERP